MSSPCLALCGLRGELTGEATRGPAIICRLSMALAACSGERRENGVRPAAASAPRPAVPPPAPGRKQRACPAACGDQQERAGGRSATRDAAGGEAPRASPDRPGTIVRELGSASQEAGARYPRRRAPVPRSGFC